jgi:hypothetical protein
MDCGTARGIMEAMADGLFPPEAETGEHAAISATGPGLRALVAVRAMEKAPALDAMWIRVRAGIEEGRGSQGRPSWLTRWFWVPVSVALAVLAVLFYPAGTDRSPFPPGTFDVSVEDLESDVATVALVDKGEDLPRVIWIIEGA